MVFIRRLRQVWMVFVDESASPGLLHALMASAIGRESQTVGQAFQTPSLSLHRENDRGGQHHPATGDQAAPPLMADSARRERPAGRAPCPSSAHAGLIQRRFYGLICGLIPSTIHDPIDYRR
jgi:hypothetical protein